MRSCEGLVDSLLYVIHTCVNTSDYDSKVSACLAMSGAWWQMTAAANTTVCMPLILSGILEPLLLIGLHSRLKGESLNITS